MSIVHGFASLALDRVISIAEPENEASIRVMRKLGMTEALRTTHPDLGVQLSVHEIIRPAVAEARCLNRSDTAAHRRLRAGITCRIGKLTVPRRATILSLVERHSEQQQRVGRPVPPAPDEFPRPPKSY